LSGSFGTRSKKYAALAGTAALPAAPGANQSIETASSDPAAYEIFHIENLAAQPLWQNHAALASRRLFWLPERKRYTGIVSCLPL